MNNGRKYSVFLITTIVLCYSLFWANNRIEAIQIESYFPNITEAILNLDSKEKENESEAIQYLTHKQIEAIPLLIDAVRNRNDSFYEAVWLLSEFDDERVFDFFLNEALYEHRRTYSYFYDALLYLAKYPEKSVPLMINIIKDRSERWSTAVTVLEETKDEKALFFLIDELRDNFYEKEEDGSRKLFGMGSPNGCMSFGNRAGSRFARALGKFGDKRAIPVLEDALSEGDHSVSSAAFHALYYLDPIPLDDLIAASRQDPERRNDIIRLLLDIGNSNIHSKSKYAIEIYDIIIESFPDDRYSVVSAHFWKIQCFTLLKQYENAIRECNEVLKYPEYNNLTEQAEKKKKELLSCINEGESKCPDSH